MPDIELPKPANIKAVMGNKKPLDKDYAQIQDVFIDGDHLLQWITDLELHFVRNEEMASDVLCEIRNYLKNVRWGFK